MRCGPLTYDGHTGTNFAIRDPRAQPNGLNVIVSAAGTIKALRDGIPDIAYTPALAQELDGKECGNGVVIAHDQGWETQYCHLKQESISVKVGDNVQVGDVLGKIGLSGRTQFPHVHVSVRHNGTRIDPFAPSGRLTCNASVDTLWDTPLEYDAGGLLSLRFFDHLPKIETLRFGRETAPLTNQSPAIVIAAFGFGAQKGDTVTLRIDGPRSTVFEHSVTMDRNQAQFMRSGEKKLSRRIWRSGEYHATATMTRDGK
jgi:murein DD-endopeptidase MepM/ murein hydrolase activator NlpD